MIKNLGSKRKQVLLEIFKNPKNIYHANQKDFLNIKIKGFGEKIINNILEKDTKNIVEKHLDYMIKNNIDIITIEDDEYPKLLKHIYDKPVILYIKGNKKILNNKSISIVGCREPSIYGQKAAKYFAYNLAKREINIISGLAKGIDSCSHIGALMANGKTVAVIGNGLDMIYPKENNGLANEIIKKGGAIITEYPLGVKPEKLNFPARNRIISGISKGLIVVEAKAKSGTLITVDFALEQGRDVFVVPGNINSINSIGTNELIKQGAKLVTNYKDILD